MVDQMSGHMLVLLQCQAASVDPCATMFCSATAAAWHALAAGLSLPAFTVLPSRLCSWACVSCSSWVALAEAGASVTEVLMGGLALPKAAFALSSSAVLSMAADTVAT